MKHLSLCINVLLASIAMSCSGYSDETELEGGLLIYADKTSMLADGTDEVIFTVKYNGVDVSGETSCALIREYESDRKQLQGGQNGFTTTTAGTYTITARYWDGKAVYTRNSVKVEALPVSEPVFRNYSRRILAVYFTSVGCSGCPVTTATLTEMKSESSGELSVIAFHTGMATIDDPMTIPQTQTFIKALGGFETLPRLFWNMDVARSCSNSGIRESYNQLLEDYTTQTGVCLATELDEEAGTVNVTLGVTSNRKTKCRYHLFIVEDGISGYDQMGAVQGTAYVHDNVVRYVAAADAFGDRLNDNLPLMAGVEVSVSRCLTLSDEWNLSNTRIVAAALVDNGTEWVIDGFNECVLGKNAPYRFDEE